MSALDVAAKSEQSPESCWETPDWLVERIRKAFGGTIDLDPCTTRDNPTGALSYIAPPSDGILLPWHGESIYINPPYGRTVSHWTRKAVETVTGDWNRKIILLVPARTDSAWWHLLTKCSDAVLFFRGRIRFKGATGSPKFPSALVGLNHSLSDFDDLGIRMIRR